MTPVRIYGRGWNPAQHAQLQRTSNLRMWRRLIACLPNVQSLHINLEIPERPGLDSIVPGYNDRPQYTPTPDELDQIPWLQPFKEFKGLQKLQEVKVRIWDFNGEDGQLLMIFCGMQYDHEVGEPQEVYIGRCKSQSTDVILDVELIFVNRGLLLSSSLSSHE